MIWVGKVTGMNCDKKKFHLITEGPLMMKNFIGSCISTVYVHWRSVLLLKPEYIHIFLTSHHGHEMLKKIRVRFLYLAVLLPWAFVILSEIGLYDWCVTVFHLFSIPFLFVILS